VIGSSALGNASQLNGHAPSSISTIITMNNLASVLTYIDKNDEAEELYKDTLKLRRQELGDSHYQTIISMINLGVHYYNQGKINIIITILILILPPLILILLLLLLLILLLILLLLLLILILILKVAETHHICETR